MVARLVRIEEARGSNPLSSTPVVLLELPSDRTVSSRTALVRARRSASTRVPVFVICGLFENQGVARGFASVWG